ncbi:PREDICTED: uncharacterized protein LOC100636059 [Amphimedon queenslandica]|uniref:PLAT domain-containing protein n=1 Tax=Amphimedon queenslandica TaxID=400682 RepID=A0A1X7VSC6_AMPQE|nr:PREDICTED: uncharacterized protein LOC100636059 [Amphimedon queenslandica]|eukprot:XP_003383019.1 PREDICTED: uncharacterized protein LOC100636059 [Amphimedon queenslandica]
MKTFIFLTLFCLALAQTPPEITESFLARFRFQYNSTSAKMTVDGEGTWVRSGDVNAEEMELDVKVNIEGDNVTHHVRSVNLTLYGARDSEEYYVIEVDGKKGQCLDALLAWPHELPHIWDWLKVAKNNGTRKIGIYELQVWIAADTGNYLAVYLEKDNTPYILEIIQGGNFTRFTFMDFRQEQPHDNHSFRVPDECRGEVIADGQTDKIPSIFSEWFQFVFWK